MTSISIKRKNINQLEVVCSLAVLGGTTFVNITYTAVKVTLFNWWRLGVCALSPTKSKSHSPMAKSQAQTITYTVAELV